MQGFLFESAVQWFPFAADQIKTLDIATIDKVLVIGYFLAIFGFGSYFGKYIRSTSDFFFSGRKFSWWVIAFSMIATLVGSYSFIKYSAAGYKYGLSSSMSYLNDWFFMPLWMFGWLPIIYFTRMTSIPEYFERRFDTKTRIAALVFIAIYLIGYIGINFYTLGIALKALLGWDIFLAAIAVAVVTAIYVTSGGQTAVIMTDLLQGFLLLLAGLMIFVLGLNFLGHGDLLAGIQNFWAGLPETKRYGLTHFNEPHKFSFIGVFWQDAFASTFAMYFFNQGILMRFLSLKSVHEGRKALLFSLIFLFPLAVMAVGNAGWLGAAMDGLGMIPESYSKDPKFIFVTVTHILCKPGIFGLVMAALLAALMSTADTLINATSAIAVNDIIRPYVLKNRSDKFYLNCARIASIVAALLGLLLVPLFIQFKSIYLAHATFVAAVTPPLAVSILMGFLWKRYTAAAAFWTLIGGAIAVIISIIYPQIITPFAHGVAPTGNFKYMRALYGLVASGLIGVIVTFLTTPSKTDEEIEGLTIGSLRKAEQTFKGEVPLNKTPGGKVRAMLKVAEEGDEPSISLHPDDLEVLKAKPGDLIYLADARWWYGGLRAIHATVKDDKGTKGEVYLPVRLIESNSLIVARDVVIEKIM